MLHFPQENVPDAWGLALGVWDVLLGKGACSRNITYNPEKKIFKKEHMKF
jgi:hypothetical protein